MPRGSDRPRRLIKTHVTQPIRRKSAPVTTGLKYQRWDLQTKVFKFINEKKKSICTQNEYLDSQITNMEIAIVDYQSVLLFDFIKTVQFETFPNCYAIIKHGEPQQIPYIEEPILELIDMPSLRRQIVKFAAFSRLLTCCGWQIISQFAYENIGLDVQDFAIALCSRFPTQFFQNYLIKDSIVDLFLSLTPSKFQEEAEHLVESLGKPHFAKFDKQLVPICSKETDSLASMFFQKVKSPLRKCYPVWD